jgi:glycosyltransferase involved in cell wall biosynthesis
MADRHSERLTNDWSVRARAEWHLRLLAARTATLSRAGGFHVAVIHMNDLPFWDYGPPWWARTLRRRVGRVLLDLDDIPLGPRDDVLKPRARELGRTVDGLILGNRLLRDAYPERPAWFVPTCIEPSEWPLVDRSTRTGPPLLGWVGTPGNLRFLEAIGPALAEMHRRHGARLRVICSRAPEMPGIPVEFVRWTAEREVEDLLPLDIGLAPLEDAPKQRCKCGFKALQSMAAGLPVVASPVGVLSDIVRHGDTGFLATTTEEWIEALDRLCVDRDLRLRAGVAGRRAIEARWAFSVHQDTFVRALRGIDPDDAGTTNPMHESASTRGGIQSKSYDAAPTPPADLPKEPRP